MVSEKQQGEYIAFFASIVRIAGMVLPVCLAPHPALRMKASVVRAFTDDLHRLVRNLIETMYAHDGIGLAAPQVGQGLQVFVVNPSGRRGRELVVVNPVLERSTGRVRIVEGCLSLPKIWERVRRASHVRMSGQDLCGSPLVVEADGLLAIALQHELDHLHGRLFTQPHRKPRLAARIPVAPHHACA